VLLEALHLPDSGARYEALYGGIYEPLRRLPLTDAVAERALEVQRLLAGRSHGLHRRKPVDFLVAAIAEAHRDEGVVLWAFDDDFRIIADATGQIVELETSAGPGI
jgi:predicted nucleic acid-binding protein